MKKSDHNTTLQELKKEAASFVRDRDWEQFHTPQTLAISISVEAAELLELFTWLDSPKILHLLQTDKEFKQKVHDELGDIMLSITNFANTLNIDITSVFLEKLQKTKSKYPVEQWRGTATKK